MAVSGVQVSCLPSVTDRLTTLCKWHYLYYSTSRPDYMHADGSGSSDVSFQPTHSPTNQKHSRQLDVTSCARNALIGSEKDICKCNRDCAYADGFPILAWCGRHCFMQLTASAVPPEQCTTTATSSPSQVPKICDHLQLILKKTSLVAP